MIPCFTLIIATINVGYPSLKSKPLLMVAELETRVVKKTGLKAPIVHF